MSSVQIHDLPKTAQEMIGVIGLDNTMLLIQKLHGVRYQIPQAENNNDAGKARFDELVSVIGVEATHKLIAVYGGSMIDIPVARRARGLAMVKTLRQEGKTIEYMVRATGYSRRNVLNLLEELKKRKPT